MKNSNSGGKNNSAPPGIFRCLLCGNNGKIEHPDTWKQVVGWVGGPKKDSMRLREDTGEYAHDECVGRLQSGQAVDQPTMFEVTENDEPIHTRESHLPDLLGGN